MTSADVESLYKDATSEDGSADERPRGAPARETMLGSLCRYICNADADNYQPTNAAFGLLPPAPSGIRRKKDKREARVKRALAALDDWIAAPDQAVAAGESR